MSARVRQVAWVAAALVVPVVLSAALLPLRYHVDDVLVAVVLLAVSSAVLARAEWLPRIVAGVSAALSFNFFYARPYDQFGGGVQAIETTVVLALAVPVLAAWVGRLSGREAAREKPLREQAERNAVKHARASAVDIQVDMLEGMLTVQVSDDGVGGADASCGSGLTGIRDRVEAVGGTLAVHSPPCSGTVLTARLPPEIHSADQRIPASWQAGISGGRGRGLGARPDATRPLRRHRRCESGWPAEENVMDRKAPKAESPLARPCHEAIDHHDPVHEWRVRQLSRLGIPWSLAHTVADQVDWHQVARLVQHGCPPRLALSIVH